MSLYQAPENIKTANDLTAKLEHLKNIKRSFSVYRIDCGSCNGCEIEIFAAITPMWDPERFGFKLVANPRHADILLCTGPVTRQMYYPLLRAYEAAPDPKIVVAFGACGSTGGIFYDAYSVWGGIDKIIPVDVYIPGCPPHPASVIYGLGMALGIIDQKLHKKSYENNPKYQRDAGDWINWTIPGTDYHLPMFQSGFGDGTYPTYIAYDKDNNPCQLIIEFIDIELAYGKNNK